MSSNRVLGKVHNCHLLHLGRACVILPMFSEVEGAETDKQYMIITVNICLVSVPAFLPVSVNVSIQNKAELQCPKT